MATAGYGGEGPVPPDQTRALIAQTKTLLNQQLKHILSVEELKVSGVKSELQQRIISREFDVCILRLLFPQSLPYGAPTSCFFFPCLKSIWTDIQPRH